MSWPFRGKTGRHCHGLGIVAVHSRGVISWSLDGRGNGKSGRVNTSRLLRCSLVRRHRHGWLEGHLKLDVDVRIMDQLLDFCHKSFILVSPKLTKSGLVVNQGSRHPLES